MRITAIFIFIAFGVLGQKQSEPFHLPKGAERHIAPGVIVAKLKPEFQNMKESALTKRSPLARKMEPLVPFAQQAKNRQLISPRLAPSNVDLSLYCRIEFEGNNLESMINELYNTGYFEIVEPDYIAEMDFIPDDPQRTSQYYLNTIRAYEAWDITKGSEEIVIGIIDSGGDMDHPDLASQIYINEEDPIDGIDNDNDGYIDNYRGWDFIGSDTLNANAAQFMGDNDVTNPNGGLGSHGTAVAGCASAATNNGVGIAGVGYKTKLLFTKHSADNQKPTRGGIYSGYSGILYAATHGAKIINCSWGGTFFSQIQQDLITYVTLDLGVLVVASAGNSNSSVPNYPASYEYVISVASSGPSDEKSSFSNFGNAVDIIAPGESIRTSFFNNTYVIVDGTSFSSPITAGAAALVWAQNPDFTPIQVGEQLRVTADETIYLNSPSFAKKLGKGRLDVFAALTKHFPALRATNPKLVNANGSAALPGEEAFLSMDITNHLFANTPGLSISLSPAQAGQATISKSTIQPGVIGANQVVNTRLNPFRLTINPATAQNTILEFILTYSDGEYSDYQTISFLVNPTFLDVDENRVITTIASNGRLGFENPSTQSNGVGFVTNDENLLYEMGVMMGTSTTLLFDNVRGTNGDYNQEFVVKDRIREIVPGERSASEIYGSFTDNGASKTVSVNYRTLAWNEQPFDRFVIMEYKIKNISQQALNGFYFGIFADWDVTDQGTQDSARWDSDNLLGYVYPALPDDRPYAGIRLLKGISPNYYAIDNNQSTPGVPFGLYDGFTDSEKFLTLSSGIGRTDAGINSATGGDVSHVIGAGPYNISVNEEITVAFALIAAPDFSSILNASKQADTAYNLMLTAPQPQVSDIEICYGSAVTVVVSGANNFNWYKKFIGGEPFFSGSSFLTDELFSDTTFYVSNADASYESIRTPAYIKVLGNPEIQSSSTGAICDGTVVILSVGAADSYLWNTGETTQSIEIQDPGDYSVHVETTSPACQSDSEAFTLTVKALPDVSFTVTGDLLSGKTLSFNNTSSVGTAYLWNFGDSKTSTEESPTHSYKVGGVNYEVTLQVTNEFGCTNTAVESILVVTGLKEEFELFDLYPVPASQTAIIKHSLGEFSWKLYDNMGRIVKQGNNSEQHTNELGIPLDDLASGVYYITVTTNTSRSTKRIIHTVD